MSWRTVNWFRVSLIIALALTAGWIVANYALYASTRDRLRDPTDRTCAGDVACISELTAEHFGDFSVRAILITPFVFLFGFGLCVVLFAAIERAIEGR